MGGNTRPPHPRPPGGGTFLVPGGIGGVQGAPEREEPHPRPLPHGGISYHILLQAREGPPRPPNTGGSVRVAALGSPHGTRLSPQHWGAGGAFAWAAPSYDARSAQGGRGDLGPIGFLPHRYG